MTMKNINEIVNSELKKIANEKEDKSNWNFNSSYSSLLKSTKVGDAK